MLKIDNLYVMGIGFMSATVNIVCKIFILEYDKTSNPSFFLNIQNSQ